MNKYPKASTDKWTMIQLCLHSQYTFSGYGKDFQIPGSILFKVISIFNNYLRYQSRNTFCPYRASNPLSVASNIHPIKYRYVSRISSTTYFVYFGLEFEAAPFCQLRCKIVLLVPAQAVVLAEPGFVGFQTL